MTLDKTLRVGLVGTGFLAETRVRCWTKVHGVRVELAGVASREAANARAFAKLHDFEQAADDAQALLERDDIDLVDLCVPNHLHRPLTEAAARAGKHVLCTKPMAAYVGQGLPSDASAEDVAGHDRSEMLRIAVADAEAMVAAATESGVQLHYGENWIFAPSIRRAAELHARTKSPLLEQRGWECHSGSHSTYSKDWRHTGGGALLRLGAHPIGAMIWLKREEGMRLSGKPARVVAVTAEVTDLCRHSALNESNTYIATGWCGVENWGCAILHFDDGSRAVAYGSDNVLGGMQSKLELYASDHQFQCNLSPHDLVKAYAAPGQDFGGASIMEKVDGPAGWSTPLPDEDWSSGQLGLCQAVAESVTRGDKPIADGELGLDVTRVVYAAYLSAADGRRIALE